MLSVSARLAGVLWLLCLCGISSGSNSSLDWNQGEIVLRNGERLIGEIGFNPEYGLVNYRSGKKQLQFAVFSVSKFSYHDTRENTVRLYVPFCFGSSPNQTRFYEVLIDGPVRLLRGFTKEMALRAESPYHYYWVVENEKFPLAKFRKRVWPKLGKVERVKNYALERGLDIEEFKHQVIMVNYYNLAAGAGRFGQDLGLNRRTR